MKRFLESRGNALTKYYLYQHKYCSIVSDILIFGRNTLVLLREKYFKSQLHTKNVTYLHYITIGNNFTLCFYCYFVYAHFLFIFLCKK